MSDTPIAALVARLLEAGVDHWAIVDAVATAEIVSSRASQRDVTGDAGDGVEITPGAARTRKWRENRKQKQLDAKANDVASGGDVRASPVTSQASQASPRPDSLQEVDSINETQKGRSKKVRKKESEGARARGERMPEGAVLTDELREVAIKSGAPIDRVGDWWDEFVNYWCAVPGWRGLKTNWMATWRNRVKERVARGDGNGGGPNGHGGRSRRKSASEVAFELAEQVRAREAAAGSRGSNDLFGRG